MFQAKNAAEIAKLLRLADRHGFPVVPRGAGTGLSGGCVAERGGVILTTTAMNRILALDTLSINAIALLNERLSAIPLSASLPSAAPVPSAMQKGQAGR